MSAAPIALATEADLEIPPVACAPWCQYGDMHLMFNPAERDCWSEEAVVPLSHQAAVKVEDNTWRRAFVGVSLRRPAGESALLYMSSEDIKNGELQFDLEAAIRLRDRLSELIATAQSAGD